MRNLHNDQNPSPTNVAPLVSVWMITYNHEQFIGHAIESILMQKTNFPVELVIGEDFSTDKTREICLHYSKLHPEKIRLLLSDKNRGIMANFVHTLNACRGKYVALCEGDDYWTDPLKLQKQVDFLEQNPDYALCFHDIELVGTTDLTNPIFSEPLKNKTTFEWDELLEYGNFIFTPTAVFRRKEGDFPFAEIIPGDYFLHLWTGYGKKIFRIAETMAAYRVHSGGAFSTKKNWNLERIVQHHLNLKTGYQRLSHIFPLNIQQKMLVYQHLFNASNSLRFVYLYQKKYLKSALVSWNALFYLFYIKPKSIKLLLSVFINAILPLAFRGRVNNLWK